MDHRYDEFLPAGLVVRIALAKGEFPGRRILVVRIARLAGIPPGLRDRRFEPAFFVACRGAQLLKPPIVRLEIPCDDTFLDALLPLDLRTRHLSVRRTGLQTPFLLFFLARLHRRPPVPLFRGRANRPLLAAA